MVTAYASDFILAVLRTVSTWHPTNQSQDVNRGGHYRHEQQNHFATAETGLTRIFPPVWCRGERAPGGVIQIQSNSGGWMGRNDELISNVSVSEFESTSPWPKHRAQQYSVTMPTSWTGVEQEQLQSWGTGISRICRWKDGRSKWKIWRYGICEAMWLVNEKTW